MKYVALFVIISYFSHKILDLKPPIFLKITVFLIQGAIFPVWHSYGYFDQFKTSTTFVCHKNGMSANRPQRSIYFADYFNDRAEKHNVKLYLTLIHRIEI